jgi:cyanosortase A-associated protein
MVQQIERFRLGLIVVLFSSILIVLAKINLFPNQKTTVTFTLPSTVSLLGWQSRTSEPIHENYPNFQSGRKFQYHQNKTTIDAEMRHLINTDGDVKQYLERYRSMSLTQAPLMRYQTGVGFYGLVTDSDRAYLSACINPRGESTFTGIQFGRNRNTLDLQVDRILPWLLGVTELRDHRCLWVILSIPAEGNAEKNYRVLEAAWFSLYTDLQAYFSQK